MLRIAAIFLSVFTLNMVSGQDTAFDKKVEQLFFNVNVSNRSESLVDTFVKNKLLVYEKPEGYTVYPFIGKAWGHYFIFTEHSSLKCKFDTGQIEVQVNDDGTGKKVGEVWWSLWFYKKEDALRSFEELVKHLKMAHTISKVYHSKLAIKEGEFINTSSKKYPYLMLSLGDNRNFDKMYKIVLLLNIKKDSN